MICLAEATSADPERLAPVGNVVWLAAELEGFGYER
jgi:hypothetical protein